MNICESMSYGHKMEILNPNESVKYHIVYVTIYYNILVSAVICTIYTRVHNYKIHFLSNERNVLISLK